MVPLPSPSSPRPAPGQPWNLATRLALCCLLWLWPGAGHAHPGEPYLIALEEEAGPYRVTIWADPDTGEGTFLVELIGHPRAALALLTRPRDGHLPEQRFHPSPDPSAPPNLHSIKVPFDQVGPWSVRLEIQGAAGAGQLEREVEVTPPGLVWWQSLLLLLPFAGLGALWLLGLGRQAGRPQQGER